MKSENTLYYFNAVVPGAFHVVVVQSESSFQRVFSVLNRKPIALLTSTKALEIVFRLGFCRFNVYISFAYVLDKIGDFFNFLYSEK